MRFLYSLILSFTSFSITAQQWVIDEIADEQKTSESIPGWLIVLLLIIGYFVYKHIQKKDDEAAERHAKERRMEEKQRLEEVLFTLITTLSLNLHLLIVKSNCQISKLTNIFFLQMAKNLLKPRTANRL